MSAKNPALAEGSWPGRGSGISDIGYMVKSPQQGLRAVVSRHLRTVGVSMADFTALSVMANAPGLSNAELARLCFVTPQTMHQVVTRLESRGLIVRHHVEEQRGGRSTHLTPAGRKALGECMRINDAVHAAMLAQLDPGDRERLAHLLQACLDGLSYSLNSAND